MKAFVKPKPKPRRYREYDYEYCDRQRQPISDYARMYAALEEIAPGDEFLAEDGSEMLHEDGSEWVTE
jgi:hypothetical protein